MWYDYNIADIHCLCDIPFELTIHPESEAFLFPVSDPENIDADVSIRFIETTVLSDEWKNGQHRINRYYMGSWDNLRIYFCEYPGAEPYACFHWNQFNSAVCYFLSGSEKLMNFSRNITNLVGIENLVLRFHGLMMHSSFVRGQNGGVIFTAPSGTGKSTQADLWKKYENADILNGDRSVLRKSDKDWSAFGLPLAGTSGIFRNESAPVKAVVVLRQAKENRIRRLGPAEALRMIYPEVSIHHWDPQFVDRAVNLIIELVSDVPIYLLECLPDKGAVDILKNELFMGEEKR